MPHCSGALAAGEDKNMEPTKKDSLTPEQRHKCMAAIKSKNSKPELLVRKFLFSKGFRYRLHDPRLPGKPDLVLKKHKAVVFIDGCFWHWHEGSPCFRMPQSNRGYWLKKLGRNKERDAEITAILKERGWRVFRIWECGLKKAGEREKILSELARAIKY